MMLLVPKRGFKDCPGFLNSPEGWGPKEGGNATSPLHPRGPQPGQSLNPRFGTRSIHGDP